MSEGKEAELNRPVVLRPEKVYPPRVIKGSQTNRHKKGKAHGSVGYNSDRVLASDEYWYGGKVWKKQKPEALAKSYERAKARREEIAQLKEEMKADEPSPEPTPEPVPEVPVKPKRVLPKGFGGGNIEKRHDWEAIRRGRIEHGWTEQELSEKFDVPLSSVKKKASVERWPSVKMIKRRMELRAGMGDAKAVAGLHGAWVSNLRSNLLPQLEKIMEMGDIDISKMSDDEIKAFKLKLSLFREMEATLQTNTLRGVALRKLELDENPEEKDSGKIDMSEVVKFMKMARGSKALNEAAIDISSDGLKRLNEAEELANKPSIKPEKVE